MRIIRPRKAEFGGSSESGVVTRPPEPEAKKELDDPLANFIGDMDEYRRKKDKAKKKGMPEAARKRQIESMEDRIKRQKLADTDRDREACWDGITPGQLVALYFVCHKMLYGVVPEELTVSTTWTNAMKCAGKMVKDSFDGDTRRAVNFMRWVWTQERTREEWRRKNQVPAKRITWQQQFIYKNLITDWRAEGVRRQA